MLWLPEVWVTSDAAACGDVKVVLLEPSLELGPALLELAAELRANSEPFGRELSQITADNLAEALASFRRSAEGLELPPGYVAMSTYFAFSNDKLVGFSRLRHQLNDVLRQEGGHIGYFVRPAARRRGVATETLTLTLRHARSRGLQRVLVTCDADNLASRRVIEKNEGVLECEVKSGVSGKVIRRYWVAT